MNYDYNVIQYVIPENAELFFTILPHARDVFFKLFNGVAEIHIKQRQVNLPLYQEFPIPIWECLWPYLKATTACDFLVHGSHYVYLVIQNGLVESTLFRVFPSGNSFSFVLEKNIQLQIFPSHNTEKDSNITIRSTRGAPEVFGYKLSPKIAYSLTPYCPVVIKSSDGESYSVFIVGLNRRVRLSTLDENYHMSAKSVKDHIFTQCLLAKKFKNNTPTILVLGPRNVGKSSFCQLLLNEALEKEMTPMYVDLNVARNLSIPGSLSLTEIGSRIHSTLDFKHNFQRLLHFGYDGFNQINIRIYYRLIRKMGNLLSFYQTNNDKRNSLAVIDTCGSLGNNSETIECIIKSLVIDLVVVIGEQSYYENLKNSILKTVASEFILKPHYTEPKNINYETRFCKSKIRKYFFGSIVRPFVQHVRIVKFDCMNIYKISVPTNDHNVKNEKIGGLIIEPVQWSPGVVDHILAVSAAKRAEFLAVTEIKYYVCFTAVDMSTKSATVLIPESVNFYGGNLLIGYVKMPVIKS